MAFQSYAFFSRIVQLFVSIWKIHEKFTRHRCWFGALVSHRRLSCAEWEHDEWWHVGLWLDGRLWRNVDADFDDYCDRRSCSVDRQTKEVKGVEKSAERCEDDLNDGHHRRLTRLEPIPAGRVLG